MSWNHISFKSCVNALSGGISMLWNDEVLFLLACKGKRKLDEHFIKTGRYVCLFPLIIDDKSIQFMLLLKDQSP